MSSACELTHSESWVGVPLLGSGNKLVGYVYFRIKWARLYTITHSESEWSRRGAISDLTNVRLRIFNSASVNTYSGITTIWQWQWCLNADSGSTNLTRNAAYKAEKYENSGGTERILLYLCKLVGYVHCWSKWAQHFSPLILNENDFAETQFLIWRMSGWG